MMSGFGWAKNPMVKRMHEIHQEIPITLLYGSRSWIDNSAGEAIKQSGHHDYVHSQIISGAGHHVYADKPEIFNRYVNDACNSVDTTNKTVAIRNANNALSLQQNKYENTESDQEDEEFTTKNRTNRRNETK